MKFNIKVTFTGLPDACVSPAPAAAVIAVLEESELNDMREQAEMVFDPVNTLKNYNLNEVVFLCGVAKALGVHCATQHELFELLAERRSYVIHQYGNDVVEVDAATDQSLSREESIAKTIHALGPFTNVTWPVSYSEQYRHLTGLVKRTRLNQAQQRILEMDRAWEQGEQP